MNTPRRSQRRRRIAVVTGTRAEYGLLRTVIRAVDDHPQLKLQLVAGGMHLLRDFGMTIRDIERDGWRIDARIPMQRGDGAPADQAVGMGRGVERMGRFFAESATDVVVVLGDRIEAMAGALAATATGSLLAHIHGGDLAPGDVDNRLRDAMTKLAHVHFAASEDAARRIVAMGEPAESVHVVGAPGLDELLTLARQASPTETVEAPFALVVQHPTGRPASRERAVTSSILRAISESGLRAEIIFPNTDRGHQGVVQAIEQFAQKGNGCVIHRSLPRNEYLHRLMDARMLVGNSSSGMIEACAAGTPVVNVGDRQLGRAHDAAAVIHAEETRKSILAALAKARKLRVDSAARPIYGDGHAGERIAHVLANMRIERSVRRKVVVSR